ncbi:hypothetical protein Raf01_76600 [Rugosimonospora africana]|uniref:NACHT domain-containing protein n=2 Tax=Rugosimonospora africana TaxID=556532 RepID=A0A8J3QZ01_9ACTN|nr:hypothetical protein Raf01_76600 [Rugosimonospora africana]
MGAGGRQSRRTWILAALWIVAIVFAVVVGAQDDSGGSSLISKVVAGVSALATLVSLASDLRPRGTDGDDDRAAPGDQLAADDAGQLADAVLRSWSAEEEVRRLHSPWLLPVAWQLADSNLSSVPEVVFRSPATGEVLPPGQRGPEAGELGDLVELFTTMPRHRLVVLGPPGSGKSVFVIEVTLALLRRRKPGEAVPLPLQLASWDPEIDLNEWLIRQLTENYLLTSSKRRSPQDIARELVENGKVLAILDGLDEVPQELWSAAVKRLNRSLRAGQPLILTCRTDDYRTTVRAGNVVSESLAVELRPTGAETALRYLTEAAPGGDSSAAWAQVSARVRTDPDGPLAATLRSPLMISMAREIYCDGPRDPRDLLDERFDTRETIERHLLGELIPATYQRGGQQSRQRLADWSHGRPEHWLRYLAARGSSPANPSISWWQFDRAVAPLVVGALPAIVAAALVGYLLGPLPGLAFALLALIVGASGRSRAWTLETVLAGWFDRTGAFDSDPVRRERTARWIALTAGRLIAAAAGVGYGYTIYQDRPLYRAAADAVMVGMAVGLADGFFTISLRTTPTEMRIASYRGLTAFLRRFLIYLAMGAAASVTAWVLFRSPYVQLVIAVVFFTFGLVDSINVWLDVPTDVTRALSPRSTRRDERFAAIARSVTVASTVSGVTLALYWIAGAPRDGIGRAVVVGIGYGLADRLMGLATSVWGRYLIMKTWAAVSGDLPVRLMLFLDDAHRRGVLRRAGAVYQFRHARLQQHLVQSGSG